MPQNRDRAAQSAPTHTSHVEDRFDRLPRSGRVGAHRITARPRYFWQFFVGGLIGFALLTTLGIVAVQVIGSTGQFTLGDTTTSSTNREQVTPELDPEATVAVLNGTEVNNLAAGVDEVITNEQWGTILFSGSAAASDVQISAVFYTDPEDAPEAAGLAAQLGGLSTYTSSDYLEYGARLVVLLGADYAGPGLEQANRLTAEGQEGIAGTGMPATTAEVNPVTGREIDPATGWDIDAESGWLVDPNTDQLVDPATVTP